MDNNGIWDKFLNAWPVEKVQKMKLPEYTSAGSKDTFTYWLESKLDTMGSIWGGSSFKFGIYSRNNKDHQDSDNKRSYTQDYGWYTKDGVNPEEAFENIKERIIEVIKSVQSGKIEQIDKIDLGPAYKWKIAFHYQDRKNPCVLAIFTHTALAKLCGEKASTRKISEYHKKLMNEKKAEEDVIDFSYRMWSEWKKIITIDTQGLKETEIPLNTIFYGPPGTGKTYNTMTKALKIICLSDRTMAEKIGLMLDDPKADRTQLEKIYHIHMKISFKESGRFSAPKGI
jgi:5-methylcytosine-specific restriction protein B